MTADLRAAALTARDIVRTAHKAYRDHARQCTDVCEYDLWWTCDTGKALQQTLGDAAQVAWDTHAAYAPAGATVVYHGSLTEHHGQWMVTSITPQSYGSAYSLARDDGGRLSDVRLESFTIAEPAEQSGQVTL